MRRFRNTDIPEVHGAAKQNLCCMDIQQSDVEEAVPMTCHIMLGTFAGYNPTR